MPDPAPARWPTLAFLAGASSLPACSWQTCSLPGLQRLAALDSRSGAPAPAPCSAFAGLQNGGATCYMSSVFQQLFMQPTIRCGMGRAAVQADAASARCTLLHVTPAQPQCQNAALGSSLPRTCGYTPRRPGQAPPFPLVLILRRQALADPLRCAAFPQAAHPERPWGAHRGAGGQCVSPDAGASAVRPLAVRLLGSMRCAALSPCILQRRAHARCRLRPCPRCATCQGPRASLLNVLLNLHVPRGPLQAAPAIKPSTTPPHTRPPAHTHVSGARPTPVPGAGGAARHAGMRVPRRAPLVLLLYRSGRPCLPTWRWAWSRGMSLAASGARSRTTTASPSTSGESSARAAQAHDMQFCVGSAGPH